MTFASVENLPHEISVSNPQTSHDPAKSAGSAKGCLWVAVVSEFGRTPKINKDAGRDHWSDVFSVMLTGGGLKTGQVLGTSNARAEIPHDRPIHYNDVLATIYRQLGVATDRVFMDEGRPVPILYQGTSISELI